MAKKDVAPEGEGVNNTDDVEVETTDVEIGDEEIEKIAAAVMTKAQPGLEAAVEAAVTKSQESILQKYLSKIEPSTRKNVDGGEGDAEGDDVEGDDKVPAFLEKGIKAGLYTPEMATLGKEMRLFKAFQALANNDQLELKRYNDLAVAFRQKAGYANEGTSADGGALVPDPEFDTTVYENLPKYGVAFSDADVRQTDRTSVRFLTLDSGLAFYATAEAGVKTGAKLAFSKELVDLAKYAVIVPATDELTDDAAIDFWNLVTRELSRAYAKLADEITFTNAVSGITNTSGVITQPVTGAGTTISWDDLLKAEGKTEDDLDESGAKWYMRKETWFRLIQLKGTTNDHYLAGSLADGWIPNPNTPQTPWGTPVRFTRVLPTSGASAGSPGVVGSNDGFAVYGDLQNYVLYSKRGMALTILREATVVGSDSVNFNLATQDGTAMRAVVRLLGKLPKGSASKFVVVGTGTVS